MFFFHLAVQGPHTWKVIKHLIEILPLLVALSVF